MTHLANIINQLLHRHDLKAAWVARKIGIDPSYFSRLRSGKQGGVSVQVLSAMATVLGKTSSERAEIISAHLRDESCGYIPRIIQLSLNSKPASSINLDPHLEYLQKHLDDSRLRSAVKSLVDLHRNGNKNGNASH